MATWNKIKFFYDTMLGCAGSTLTATSTAAGDYSVGYLYNMLEVNMWKAATAADPHCITYDAGAGNSKTADYLAISGHNLKAMGAAVALQHSSDDITYADAFTAFTPSSDTVVLKEFPLTAPYRYWRLKIIGMTAPPYMTICIWGNKTELDYATATFDPYEQAAHASVNLSYGGYVAGVHTQYTERRMNLKFEGADLSLYGKVKAWWETSGLKNFFLAWETANNPDDVFLLRPDTRFYNPLRAGGLYRDITINLTGRRE